MQSASSPVRQARAHYRHDLRSLTYVVLDAGNGGIVRNLTHEGMGIQAVAAPRPNQNVRIRFELRNPKVRVETQGQVVWSTSGGQCGIRFVDLPSATAGQINEWIFGNLLESIPQHSGWRDSMFAESASLLELPEVEDGLILSGVQPKAIELEPPPGAQENERDPTGFVPEEDIAPTAAGMVRLSRSLSPRFLSIAVDALALTAAFLLFATIFLSVARHLPRWPMNLLLWLIAAALVMGFYCAFCYALGGESFGTKLGRLWQNKDKSEDEEAEDRDAFR